MENMQPELENEQVENAGTSEPRKNSSDADLNSTDNVSENSEEENTGGDNKAMDAEQLIKEEKDKYLRLYSEFDNFRKRTAKDRLEWMQTASKDLIVSLLPVVDDFERAIKAMEQTGDTNESAKEGILLIYNKMMGILQKSGLQSVNSIGEVFDVEKHEAITQFAAPTEEMKGRVIDEVEKGYVLHDKIIRFAKVVVGN